MGIAPQGAGSRVRQHATNECDHRRQLGDVTPPPRTRHRVFGVAHHRVYDPQEPLVEPFHCRLAPRADLRGHARAGRATALRDREDPARHAARALAGPLSQSAQPLVSTRTPSAKSVVSVG